MKVFDSALQSVLRDKVRFEVISWIDEVGNPGATCQIFFADKLIGERSTEEKKDVSSTT